MSNENIGKKIAKGTVWTVLMRMSIRFLGIISIIILARLLLPEDYGLVAKAVLIGGFLELMTQFGFGAALIKNQNATKEDYDTVWTLSIIRSVVIGLTLVLTASIIADYFDDARIEALIYCYAFANTIMGFNNVGVIDFQKNMEFNKDFKISLLKKTSSFCTTISIAFIWESYWAFPIGVLMGNIVGLIASFQMSAFKPRLSLSSFHSIFNFSKWIFFYEMVSAISTKLDTFLLSKFSSAEELGLYTISYEVAGMPSTEVAMPVARASLPGLSKLSSSKDEFKGMYVNIISSVLFLAIPASAGLSVLANDITLVLLGDNWIKAVPLISILSFFGISRVITACGVSGLIAFDRVDLLSKFSIIMLVIKIIVLPFTIIYAGYIGVAYGILFTGIIGGSILLVMQQTIGAFSIKSLFYKIWRTILSSLLMYCTLYYLGAYIDLIFSGSMIFILIIKIAIGLSIFSFSVFGLWFASGRKDAPEGQIYDYLMGLKA